MKRSYLGIFFSKERREDAESSLLALANRMNNELLRSHARNAQDSAGFSLGLFSETNFLYSVTN